MTTATTRIWTFAAALVAIAVIALGWFLGAAPKLAEAARFDEERRAIELQNDATRIAIAQLEQDAEQIDVIRAEVDELRTQFPFTPEYDDAIEDLLAGIGAEGLQISSVALGAPSPDSPDTVIDENGQVPAGTLMRIPVAIGVTGNFAQALSLIDRLQSNERFGFVVSADFVEGRDPNENGTLIQLVLFVLTDEPVPLVPSEGGAAPEPAPSPEPTPAPSVESTDSPTPAPSGTPGATPSPQPTNG